MKERTTSAIAPIETLYAGCRFRSRLEARWAVFFDALSLRWDYEPDAYALPSGAYLPDFRLHLAGGPVWFEVKAPNAEKDDARWSELGQLTGLPVYVAFGMPKLVSDPGVNGPELSVDLSEDIFLESPACDHYQAFCVCARCGRVGLAFDGRSARICGDRCYPDSDKEYNWSDPRLIQAFRRALSMRFEPQRPGGRR